MTSVCEVSDFDRVIKIVKDYFDGLHNADVKKLSSIFHDDVFLKSPGQRRSVNQWLEDVANREVPATLGHGYNYKITAIDVVDDQAMVKLECPLFSHQYIDYLGLLKEDNRWLIVSKMYTDVKKIE
jgi:hypothetical protein